MFSLRYWLDLPLGFFTPHPVKPRSSERGCRGANNNYFSSKKPRVLTRGAGFTYIWLDVLLIRETQKAILIMFDGKKNWLPKAWILKIKRDKNGYTVGD